LFLSLNLIAQIRLIEHNFNVQLQTTVPKAHKDAVNLFAARHNLWGKKKENTQISRMIQQVFFPNFVQKNENMKLSLRIRRSAGSSIYLTLIFAYICWMLVSAARSMND